MVNNYESITLYKIRIQRDKIQIIIIIIKRKRINFMKKVLVCK